MGSRPEEAMVGYRGNAPCSAPQRKETRVFRESVRICRNSPPSLKEDFWLHDLAVVVQGCMVRALTQSSLAFF